MTASWMDRRSGGIRVALGALALFALVLAKAPEARALTFDPVSGFGLGVNNPGGTWSYWWSSSTSTAGYTGGIQLMPTYFANCSASTQCWYAPATNSLILRNATGAAVGFPNAAAWNDDITFFPRNGLLVLRFTAPSAGYYAAIGAFLGNATPSSTTTHAIAVNGTIVDGPISQAWSYGQVDAFNVAASLAAGGTIDFLVAGVVTTANSTTTGLDLVITAIPETSTAALMGGGLALLTASRRRAPRSLAR